MAENLFCDEPSCGLPAHVFGFVGKSKPKVCEEHIQTLIHKEVTVYSIAAFNFMQSPEDSHLYEGKREYMQRGLGFLASLETACERSWVEGQKHLQENCAALHEVVQQSYQEMWLRGQQSYEHIKTDLADLHSQLEQLLLDPTFQLSSEFSDLCEETPPDHLLCVIVGDCSVSVAETLMANFHVLAWDLKRETKRNWGLELQKFAEKHSSIAGRVAEYAKHFGVEGSDFANEATLQREETTKRLQCLLSATTHQTAEECLRVGLSASKTGEFNAGLAALQQGRNALVGSNDWELYLQLSNAMAEIHCQKGNYEDTVEICQHILSTWTPEAHSLHFLRASFNLIYAHIESKQHSLGYEAKEEWAGKLIADCVLCQCMQICIEGIIQWARGMKDEGEQSIEMALQLDPCPSYSTLRLILSRIDKEQGRLDKYQQTCENVCELYSPYFPHSLQYAICLRSLGLRYLDLKRYLEAEQLFIKGIQLYSILLPHSDAYVWLISYLGTLYLQMQRRLDAEEQLVKAVQICSVHFPHSIVYAGCLFSLGRIYQVTERRDEAVLKLKEARQLFERVGTQQNLEMCDQALLD